MPNDFYQRPFRGNKIYLLERARFQENVDIQENGYFIVSFSISSASGVDS